MHNIPKSLAFSFWKTFKETKGGGWLYILGIEWEAKMESALHYKQESVKTLFVLRKCNWDTSTDNDKHWWYLMLLSFL